MYKILVIEDEDVVRKSIVLSLDYSKLNCKIIGEAKNGKMGIELIKIHNPEIILLDINMPIIDGITLLEETIDYDYVPIIISGYDSFDYVRKTMKYGATDYLLKPIVMSELEDAIKNSIDVFKMRENYKKSYENNINLITTHETMPSDISIKVYQYIIENYTNKISLKDLCYKLCYSESLLNQKFKNDYGYTFNDYLNRYRITKSIALMHKNMYNLNEISDIVGFIDQRYFSKVFKKYMGISPSQYYKNIQK